MTGSTPPDDRARQRLRRFALAFLAAASLLVPVLSFSGSPVAQWAFAMLSVAYPPALVVLGALGRDRRRRLAWAILAFLILLEGSTVAILALAGDTALEGWMLGLPRGAIAFAVGLWLAPFLVTAWAYAATFSHDGLRPDDIEALRAWREQRGGRR